MSLGGVRGLGVGGNFPPQVDTLCAIHSGHDTPGCGQVEALTCRARGGLPDDSGTNRPQRFETSIIDTNAINRVVVGDNSHSDNPFP
jgi:hypothetical protein